MFDTVTSSGSDRARQNAAGALRDLAGIDLDTVPEAELAAHLPAPAGPDAASGHPVLTRERSTAGHGARQNPGGPHRLGLDERNDLSDPAPTTTLRRTVAA